MAGINQISFTSPYAADESAITYRRKLAEMLAKEAIEPLQTNRMAGRFVVPVSPWEGAAKLAKGIGSGLAQREAEDRQRTLGETATRDRTQALAEAMRKMDGTPQTYEDAAGNYAPQAAVAPNPRGAMEALARSNDPMLQQAGMGGIIQQMKPKEDRVVPEGAIVIGPDGKPRFENKKDFRPDKPAQSPLAIAQAELATMPPGDPRRAAQENYIRKLSEVSAQIVPKTVINQPAPVTAVTIADPNDPTGMGTIIIDGRTGKELGKGPKLTQVGTMEQKRQFNMGGIGQTIQEAEDLLTGKSGKALPTGSGIGTAVDFAAGLVGVSPDGAKEAQTLKAISGALVSKMPRMEGPQSDKDVMLYKEMAGVVGDSTVPRERRIAALEKVKELWGKYEKPQRRSSDRVPDEPPPGAVRPR